MSTDMTYFRPQITYEPSTDTMYIEVRAFVDAAPGQDTSRIGGEDAGENLVIHYDATDRPHAYEIEHASEHPEHIIAALKELRRNTRMARAAE